MSYFSDAQGQPTPKSAANEENPIKNEGAKVLQDFPHFKFMGIFSDAQGQLTPQFMVELGRNSNSSEIFRLSSLPASMKESRSKMKALEF